MTVYPCSDCNLMKTVVREYLVLCMDDKGEEIGRSPKFTTLDKAVKLKVTLDEIDGAYSPTIDGSTHEHVVLAVEFYGRDHR